MPADFSAGARPWLAQLFDIRFSSQNVATSRNGLEGAASASIAFDAAGSSMNASVSSARRRSAIGSFSARARVARSGTAAGTCSRHASRANAGDQVSASFTPSAVRIRWIERRLPY